MANKRDEQGPWIHVETHNQQGGIAAGIINIAGVLPAHAELSVVEHEQITDGYLTLAEITLVAQYTIPILEVVAFSPTLKTMSMARGSDQNVFGISEGTAHFPDDGVPIRFWRVKNASGKYFIETITEQDEVVNLQIKL